MSDLQLRPYQRDALAASKADWLAGTKRQLLVLPTGTGKGCLFAALKKHHGFKKRILVLLHREELADQAAEKIRKWNPDLRVSIEMGSRRCSPSDDVVVASVATIGRTASSRLLQFNPEEYDALVIDEVHHAISNTYTRVIEHFGFGEDAKPSSRLLLGFTATPNRSDGNGLMRVFDKIVYQMSIRDAIEQGWIVDIRGAKAVTDVDLSGVHTRAGDFDQLELGTKVNTPARNDLVARTWLEHGEDRKTIVFAVSVEHAKALAESFQRYGVAAQAVWGEDEHRKEKLEMHRKGALKVLTNISILVEGYDDPSIQCVVMARPTKSSLFFTQAIGRGTRLPEGVNNIIDALDQGLNPSKKDCLVIDMADTIGRHSLVTLPSLFGIGAKVDLKGKSIISSVQEIEDARSDNPNVDFSQLEDITKLSVFVKNASLFDITFAPEVVDNSTFQWIKIDQRTYRLAVGKDDHVVIQQDALDKWCVVGQIRGNKIADYSIKSLAEAFGFAESMIKVYANDLITLLRRKAKWHADPATEAQIKLLKNKYKMPIPPGLTKGEAAKLIVRTMYRWGKRKGAA